MTTPGEKIEAADMGHTCAFCRGRTFRRSRLQFKDVTSLLALHYPVRCLSCSKRQSVGLEVARRAVPSTVRQVRAPKDVKPWDGSPWSEPAAEALPRLVVGGVVPELRGAGSGGAGSNALGRRPMAMPDLHGVSLPHTARMPPGDGENLA